MHAIETQSEWYKQLVADVKRLAFEGIVCTKHAIGKRILQDELKFGKPEYSSKRIEGLAKDLECNARDLYYCLQFARQYPEIEPPVQSLSWRRIRGLLAEPRPKPDTPLLPDDKYRVLLADPPWKYSDELDVGKWKTAGAAYNYPVMTIDELCDLDITSITTDNAVLFLWVTSPILFECAPVIKAWGFQYKASVVWDKVKHNYGHYFSVRHEILLLCTRGSCTPDSKKLHDSVVSIERTKHSEKPEYFQQLIDTMYPHGKRIELFVRGELPGGWAGWGLEYRGEDEN